MHDNTQSSKFEMILYKLFTMHHNCCILVECHIILLTWYFTKLQLNNLQYLSTMHHMDTCFACECWLTNPGCVDCSPGLYNSRKYALPPTPHSVLHTTLRQKWGGGICSNIQFITCIHPFLHSSQSWIYPRWTITMTATAFWKTSASLNVHCGQSTALVLLQRQEASNCQWWQGTTLCKLAFSVRATKILVVVSKRGYSDFVGS